MFSPPLHTRLQQLLPALPTVIAGRSLARDIDDLVAQVLPPMRLCIVDDVNTAHALGDAVFRALKDRYECTHLSLEGAVTADDATAGYIQEKTARHDALIAVGSGTINDLCKYVSHAQAKPYLVFPTAASMNGYLSANASISFSGYKKTVASHLPKAVFCDNSVIASAPMRLSNSGLGDSLARPTAQADWLLSHLLLGTEYTATPFELIALFEPELFDSARGIAGGDAQCIELLMKVLLLSGLGMTIAGGSYPASQGEHMIAHTMDMLPIPKARPLLHGEEIGVTTLTMARLQETVLRNGGRVRSNDFNEEKLANLFSPRIAAEAKTAFAKKQTGDIAIDWDMLRERLLPVMLPSATLEAILKSANAPTTPEALGWTARDYNTALQHARYLRDRFTFLDIE